MPKSAEYRLTPEAARDMETIWLYTLKEWGLEQANRYIDELTEAFGQLAANPKMATPCDRIRKGYRPSQVLGDTLFRAYSEIQRSDMHC